MPKYKSTHTTFFSKKRRQIFGCLNAAERETASMSNEAATESRAESRTESRANSEAQESAKQAKGAPKRAPKRSLAIESSPESTPSNGEAKPAAEKKKVPKSQRVKRGPARPLRRVPKDVLEMRIEKLDKRLKRTTSQMEDASRHYAAYIRERDFRKGEDTEEPAVKA